MLDSGVTEGHPHLPSVAGGIAMAPSGDLPDFRDALGHGTAVAALIHYLAPRAELFSVKIFDRRLATSLPTVLRGLDWCLANSIDIINLSLGTANPDHLEPFAAAIARVHAANAVLVSAYAANGTLMLPGSMPGVIGVVEDINCDHADLRFVDQPTPHLAACPYPRDIEGIPREHNLHGVSFAVAHISAMIAQRWKANRIGTDWLNQLAQDAHSTVPSSAHSATT